MPDLDAVLQTSDFPCMLAADADEAPPLFGYNSHPTYTDVPFPDYSYWGHEYSHLLGQPPEPGSGPPASTCALALLLASQLLHGGVSAPRPRLDSSGTRQAAAG